MIVGSGTQEKLESLISTIWSGHQWSLMGILTEIIPLVVVCDFGHRNSVAVDTVDCLGDHLILCLGCTESDYQFLQPAPAVIIASDHLVQRLWQRTSEEVLFSEFVPSSKQELMRILNL